MDERLMSFYTKQFTEETVFEWLDKEVEEAKAAYHKKNFAPRIEQMQVDRMPIADFMEHYEEKHKYTMQHELSELMLIAWELMEAYNYDPMAHIQALKRYKEGK